MSDVATCMHIHLHMYIASTLSILRVLQPYEKIVLVYIIGTCKNDSAFYS